MEKFWQNALKVGGVTTIGLFIFWTFIKDIVPKFSILNSSQTFILVGLICILICIIIILMLFKKKNPNENKKPLSQKIISGENSDNIQSSKTDNIENQEIKSGNQSKNIQIIN